MQGQEASKIICLQRIWKLAMLKQARTQGQGRCRTFQRSKVCSHQASENQINYAIVHPDKEQ